jgi:type IX secretion system PorP/SprF family membrane protein
MNKPVNLFTALFIVSIFTLKGQIVYLNSTQSLINLNPSFAGTNGFIRDQLNHNENYLKYNGSYFSSINSIDGYIKPLRGGVAFSTSYYNNWDVFTGTNLNLAYAQHFTFREGKFKVIPSLQLGYGIKTQNIGWWLPPPGIAIEEVRSTKSYFDVGSGLLLNYNRFFIGTFVSHINQPDVGVIGQYNLSPQYNFHTSYNLFFNEKNLLNISARVTTMQVLNNKYIISANALLLNHFLAGVSADFDHTLGFNAGYRGYLFTVQIGYEYSPYRSYYGYNSLTLMASFNLRTPEKRKVLTNFEEW